MQLISNRDLSHTQTRPCRKREKTQNLTEAWSVSKLILHMRMPSNEPFVVMGLRQHIELLSSARLRLVGRPRGRGWRWVGSNLPVLSGALHPRSAAARLPLGPRRRLPIRRRRWRPIARRLAVQWATGFQIRLHLGLLRLRRSDGDDLAGIAGVRLAGELGFEAGSLCP